MGVKAIVNHLNRNRILSRNSKLTPPRVVNEGDVRIMGSKGDLLRAPTSLPSGKLAGIGVPALGLKWRRERMSIFEL